MEPPLQEKIWLIRLINERLARVSTLRVGENLSLIRWVVSRLHFVTHFAFKLSPLLTRYFRLQQLSLLDAAEIIAAIAETALRANELLPYAAVSHYNETLRSRYADMLSASQSLTKVISYNGSRRETTVAMIQILGEIVTTPREAWTYRDMQTIVNACAGVAEVARVDGEHRANQAWKTFGNECMAQSLENEYFFAALDPVMVIVDLSAGNTRGSDPPLGYHSFIASILSTDDTTSAIGNHLAIEPRPSSTVAWPSGTPPANFANSFTMFVCNTGTFDDMLLDAETLAKEIKGKFPCLTTHQVCTAGVPI